MLATLVVFGRLVRAPTTLGRELLDQITGFELYLTVAERDEIERLPAPGGPPVLDAKRYETLLPFAVALKVEEAWTAKFTAAVAGGISWYHGSGASDLGSLTRAVGGTLSSQIASVSSSPGSSSGAGGGGSSGGGGGGGGR